MAVLARLSERVVPVTASTTERGFLLTPDQGPVLADSGGDSVEHVVRGRPRSRAAPARGRRARRRTSSARACAGSARAEARRTSPRGSSSTPRCPRAIHAGSIDSRPSGCGRRCRTWTGGPSRCWPSACRSPSTTATCTPTTCSPSRGCGSSTSVTPMLSDPLAVLLATLRLDAVPPRLRGRRPETGSGRRTPRRGMDATWRLPPTCERAWTPRCSWRKLARSESWARCLATVTDEEIDRVRRLRGLLAARDHGAAADGRWLSVRLVSSEGSGALTSLHSILGFTPM